MQKFTTQLLRFCGLIALVFVFQYANAQCTANFTFTVNQATKTVTFTNTSTGADSNYFWNFGPSYSTLKNPVYTYAHPGTYNVCLTKNGPVCYDTICKTVTILPDSCDADFTFSVNHTTKTVTFTNTSTGADSNYIWTFNPGSSNAKNPVHTYANAGSYTVCLTKPACYDTICKTVIINNYCNINFGYSVNHATRTITFNNFSTGDSSYLWRFGDNTTSGVTNPVHTYASAGSYVVCLKRSGPVCFDSICRPITINNFCNINFGYSVNNATKKVTFTNTSTGDTNYIWTFGNFDSAFVKNPVYTYANYGTYTVCLKRKGPVCFDSICKTVTITNPCSINFTFFINHTTRKVTFTNTSTGDTNYIWTFGDFDSAFVKNPIHTYSSPGSYTVCLKRKGPVCFDSICKTVTINNLCNINFNYSVNQSTKTVTFNNTSTGDSSFTWTFGDFDSAFVRNPTHTYAGAGSYTVCLKRKGPVCFDSTCKTITILPDSCNVNADFTYSINHTTRTVTFNNISTGLPDSNYQWYFGFSGTSTLKNPVYTFGAAGTYMVCLYKFGNTCWDSTCKIITIDSIVPCQASFTHTYDSLTGTLNFTNTSAGTGLTYLWTFGGPNGGTSTTKNPSYHYPYNGTYLVCLKVTRTNPACTSTICDTITISQGPNLCKPITYMIQDSSNKNKYIFAAYIGPDTANRYYWDFGDGTTSTQSNLNHTYANPGMYYVCVTTIRFDGCVSKVCDTVYVPTDSTMACHADFSYTLYPDSIDGINRIAVFTNLSTGNQLIYHWSFGDGGMSNDESPMHYYDSNGVFYACLVVRDTLGTCNDTICKVIYIGADTTTGLASLSGSLNDFKVYPVPFNDVLKIRFAARTDKPVSIRIYNTLGILQHEETRPVLIGTNEYEVNAERLAKGIYFIELSNGEGTITKRTIK
ncbi:MAG: PKD domain-containing protein [Bacteroidota bacterium]